MTAHPSFYEQHIRPPLLDLAMRMSYGYLGCGVPQ